MIIHIFMYFEIHEILLTYFRSFQWKHGSPRFNYPSKHSLGKFQGRL